MAKLIEDMKQARVMRQIGGETPPKAYRPGYGQPCPLCNERPIEGYTEVRFMGRNYRGSDAKLRQQSILPGTSQGTCLICAAEIYRDIAERIGRHERVKLADEWLEAARNGSQEDPA